MLKYLIQKEFLQIRRNIFLPRLILLFPVMIMCVLPWVMNQEVKNVVVTVVDNDHSTLSRQLIESIRQSPYFKYGGRQTTYPDALSAIRHGSADIAVVIPRGYSKDHIVGNKETPQVLIAANAVNGTKGSIGSAYLSQIITTHNGNGNVNVNEKTMNEGTMNEGTKFLPLGRWGGASPSGGYRGFSLYNPHQDYKLYMIPALLAIVTMLMCGFLPALNIVGEKEAGTIEQMNVTPVKKSTLILSKLIPYWLIALLVITLCLLLSWAVYGITSSGPTLLVYLLTLLLSLFFSSFGLIVSNYSNTMQQAIFVMWFFVVILLLLSGLFTPVRSMPSWAYATTYINPMHHFVSAVRTVFIRGGTLPDILPHLLSLAAIATVAAVWAVGSYRKNSA